MSISNNVLSLRKQVIVVFGKIQKMTKGQYRLTVVMMLCAFALGIGSGQALALGMQHARWVFVCAVVLLLVPLMLVRYLNEGLERIIASYKSFEASPTGVKPWAGFGLVGLLAVALVVTLKVKPTIISETITGASLPTQQGSIFAALLLVLLFMLNWLFKPAPVERQRVPKTRSRRFGRRGSKSDNDVGVDLFEHAS